MRRLIAGVALAAALAGGCKKPKRVAVSAGEEQQGLASVVHVGDPRTAVQLVRGFHEVEQGQWRWTKGRFSVTLRPPANAATNGANLVFKFSLPDAVLDKTKKMTLSANVSGVSVQDQIYDKGGDYTYKKEVPASALKGDAVAVDFAVDNYLKAGEVETRELAFIASSIALEAK